RSSTREFMIQRLSAQVRSGDGNLHASRRGPFVLTLAQEMFGQRKQSFIGKRGSDKRNTKRQSVTSKACRKRDCREIHQVHGIRIEPKIRIQSNRIGCHGLVPVDGSRRRQQQYVHVCPLFRSALL